MDEDEILLVGTTLEEAGFTHDAIDNFFLEHYGVPGMKWGVRKSPGQKAAKTRAKNVKAKAKAETAEGKAERKAASKLSLGEAAVVTVLTSPVGLVAYKGLKVRSAKQKQAARNAGGGVKEQAEAAKVSVGTTAALAVLGTPAAAITYVGLKAASSGSVKTFKPKK